MDCWAAINVRKKMHISRFLPRISTWKAGKMAKTRLSIVWFVPAKDWRFDTCTVANGASLVIDAPSLKKHLFFCCYLIFFKESMYAQIINSLLLKIIFSTFLMGASLRRVVGKSECYDICWPCGNLKFSS